MTDAKNAKEQESKNNGKWTKNSLPMHKSNQMSRDIKFRVWDTLAKTFFYPDEGYQGHFILSLNGVFHNLQNGSGGKDYVLQQYIGIKDKEDKDVYEGDIVSWEEYQGWEDGRTFKGIYVVQWNGEYLRWDFHCPFEGMSLEAGDTCFESVVGNIFETPKLLNHEE